MAGTHADGASLSERPTTPTCSSAVGELIKANKQQCRLLIAVVAVIFSISLYFAKLVSNREANACLALLALVTIFWTTTPVPVYVTALLIPLVAVVMRIPRTANGSPMTAPEAASFIISSMFSPMILLLLGSFVIAAALNKHNCCKLLIHPVSRGLSRRFSLFLLLIMLSTVHASMVVGDFASIMIHFSLLQSLLERIEDRKAVKVIVLGLIMAANTGGMASPIGSPQSMFAYEQASRKLDIGWPTWLAVSIPVSTTTVLLVWLLIVLVYRTRSMSLELGETDSPDRSAVCTQKDFFVVGIVFMTILFWAFSSQLADYFGNIGIISLLPVVAFFATGILALEDLYKIPWDVILLAMGGTALSAASQASGLFAIIGHRFGVMTASLHLWPQVAVFALVITLGSVLLSRFMASIIFLPLVLAFLEHVARSNQPILYLSSAFACSAGMALPVSGLINMTLFSMADRDGKRYLETGDFLKIGVASTFVVYVVIISLGYGIMRSIDF